MHGIQKRDFQYGLTMAWHELTNVVPVIPGIQKTIFPEIEGKQLSILDSQGNYWPIEDSFIPIAKDDGEACGGPYNGKTYKLFTSQDAWDFVTECVQQTQFTVESAGMLKNRSIWFISIFLNELADLNINGDQTHFQLNFSGGLDRNTSVQCELNSTRIVCFNTLSLSRQTGNLLFKEKLRAGLGYTVRMEAAKKEIEKAAGMTEAFKVMLESLAQNPCNEQRAERILTGFLAPATVETEDSNLLSKRVKNQVGGLTYLFRRGDGNKGESLYDLYNGFTQGFTRGIEPTSTKDAFKLFESSEIGSFANRKAAFLSIISNEESLKKVESRGEALLAILDNEIVYN